MNQNLSSAQFPTLYHGTNHEIQHGDVVRAGVKPSNYPDHWDQVSTHAYATSSPGWGIGHGRNVYEVEPMDHEDAESVGKHEYRSQAGFRVVGGPLPMDTLKERGRAMSKGADQ